MNSNDGIQTTREEGGEGYYVRWPERCTATYPVSASTDNISIFVEPLNRDNILISHKMISLLSDQMQAINPLLFSTPDKTNARGTAVFPTGACWP